MLCLCRGPWVHFLGGRGYERIGVTMSRNPELKEFLGRLEQLFRTATHRLGDGLRGYG
jgi:hypothetical protein